MRYEKRVAIVTGAGQGIGEAYAKGLAAEGASVVVAEIQAEQGERVVTEIVAGGGTAMFVRTDVSSEESTLAMGAAVVEAYGGVDILVNNAAIYGGMKIESLLKVDWAYYERFMAVNMHGALLCTRAVYKSMHSRGGGAILNQSSTAAWMNGGFYGIAKLGVHGITTSLAAELGWRNIRVNAIAPGPTDTEATRTTVGPFIDDVIATMPIKRLGTVDDMVAAALFLLSDEASFITGHILNVDGGQMMRV